MELDEAAVFIIDFIPLRKVASWCFIIIRLKYKKLFMRIGLIQLCGIYKILLKILNLVFKHKHLLTLVASC